MRSVWKGALAIAAGGLAVAGCAKHDSGNTTVEARTVAVSAADNGTANGEAAEEPVSGAAMAVNSEAPNQMTRNTVVTFDGNKAATTTTTTNTTHHSSGASGTERPLNKQGK
jgi:hypothetical protein